MENNRLEIQPGHGPRAGTERPRRPLSASRSTLLDTLRAQHAPVTLAALATVSQLHPNTVREHLDGLVADGLATRDQAEPHGRGRPAWLYRSTGDDVAAAPEYAGLAAALAGAIARTSASPAADAEEAGARWGHTLAAQRGVTPTPVESDARRAVVDLLED
ncbi:MAG: helix-turn-helix domain-containing protein, partial [Nocardioides sp.]|uniref:helix-turn-helix domain-containing protein n=1 Tax=Nocardioides sp. TaxID=35761 RepID=UPI003F118417